MTEDQQRAEILASIGRVLDRYILESHASFTAGYAVALKCLDCNVEIRRWPVVNAARVVDHITQHSVAVHPGTQG